MARFRKKPVEIDAVRWTGENTDEILEFLRDGDGVSVVADEGLAQARAAHDEQPKWIKITTLEGEMQASVGDWVIRGVQGEYYPCKPDIFAATYEPA